MLLTLSTTKKNSTTDHPLLFFLPFFFLRRKSRQVEFDGKAKLPRQGPRRHRVVLVGLEDTVPATRQVETDALTLVEVFVESHGISLVTLVAFVNDAFRREAFAPDVVANLTSLVPDLVDVCLLLDQVGFHGDDLPHRFHGVSHPLKLLVHNAEGSLEIEVRVELTQLSPDQLLAVRLTKRGGQWLHLFVVDVHAVGVGVVNACSVYVLGEAHHFVHDVLRDAQHLARQVLSIEV